MNPNTGDILAMATYPDYNLNDPYTLDYIPEMNGKKCHQKTKYEMLQETWSNRAVTSTYEPGSVFKIVTAAAGLEEDIVEPDKANVFNCKGYEEVSGVRMYCSDKLDMEV